MASTNSEVLERLLIEVVGDDSKLKAALEDTIKTARRAAEEMRDALKFDFTRVATGAKEVGTALDTAATDVGGFGKALETQLKAGEKAFNQFRKSGEMTTEEFEEYRRGILESINVSRPFASTLGITEKTLDDLAKRVKEATYEQKKFEDQTERTEQEQEELADTIKRLSNEVRGSRNVWAGRITSDDEFRQSTGAAREELLKLLPTVDRGSTEYRKLSQELAYAQRGLDSVNKVASRGGLAWTAQIALANQFQQELRGLGPAGNVAAGALGLVGGSLGKLQAPLKITDFEITKVLGSIARFAIVTGPMIAAIGAIAGAAGLARLTTSAANAARELENASFRTGLTVEGLQELQHAARSTGVPMEVLNTTMQRLQRRAADANQGNALLRESFDRLGVSLTDSHGAMRTTEDLLGQVADGLNTIPNSADRIALAFKIFDTEGARLLPLLAEGSEGIRELREEARELGLVVSGDTVLSLSQLHAEIETVKQQFEVLKIEVSAGFLPLMRDLLIPLLSDVIIPWLQNAVIAVDNFSDAFFDTTEAGVAFRRDTVQNLNAVISLGRGVVAAANAVAVAVNSIFSVTASIGSYIGNVTTLGMDSRTRQGLRDSLEQLKELRDRAQELGDTAGVERFNSQIAATNALLGEMGSNWFTGIFRSGDDALKYAEGVLTSFDNMMGAFTFDAVEFVEGVVGGIDRNRVRRALAPVGEGIADAVLDGLDSGTREALEGSLKFAQEQLSKAQEDLAFAVGPEARADQLLIVKQWEEVIALIQAELEAFDPAKAAKAWTGRLAAEVRFGVKDAVEALDLVTPRLEELRHEAAQALTEFGFDSSQYRDTLAKLEVLEAFVKAFERDATIQVRVDTSRVSRDLERARAVIQQRFTGDAALLFTLQAVERTEGRFNSLEEAFAGLARAGVVITAPMLTLLEARFGDTAEAVDRATAAVARLREQELQRLRDIEAQRFSGDAGVTFTLQAVERTEGQFTSVEDAMRKLANVGVVLTAPMLELLDRRFGQAEDGARRLNDALELVHQGELRRVREATAARFSGDGALLLTIQSVERTAGAFTSVEDAMHKFSQAGVVITAPMLQLLIDRFENVEEEVESLTSSLDASAFDAWAQSVRGIGATSDPITSAFAELTALFAAGEIGAVRYAAGVRLVADAMARLEQIEAEAQIEKVTKAWEAAGAQLADALGVDLFDVVDSQWDEMRKAAKEASDAGIIGADELRQALRLIGILEVADGFRQIAAELGEVAGIVPNLAADLTEAFAMFTAGNTAGGIATAFQAATTAVRGLGAALEDEARRGEAALDLIIGGAAALGTALGGPAVGQAVAAVGEFVKSVLGDLSNGLVEIQREVEATASRSQWLGEGLVRGIAEGATQTVSRGGVLGLLGFTKQELDDDAFRAGISVAEGLASGLVNTLRSGDFEEAWQSFIDDIIINGIIEAFIATALVQDAIEEAMELIMGGDAAGGAAALDRLKDDFRQVWETIQGITTTPLPSQDDLERSVTFSLPDATVSVLAAPQWALELQTAAERMSEAGSAMLTAADVIQDVFDRGLPPVETTSSRGIDAARSL